MLSAPLSYERPNWRPRRSSGIRCDSCGIVFAIPAPWPNEQGRRICRDCRPHCESCGGELPPQPWPRTGGGRICENCHLF